MKLSHNSLAVVSGVILLLIIAGVYWGNSHSVQPETEMNVLRTTEDVENTTTSSETENNEVIDTVSETTLDLSGKNLEQVPNYVFQKTEIEILLLSNNNLSGALQGEIRFLSHLKVLDLSNNTFTGVPAEIGQLSNLEVLNLSNNNLTGLPLELGNLNNLKTLDLRGNDYAQADLESIQAKLPDTTTVLVD